MEWQRKIGLMVKWSFLSGGLIALFWIAWHLVIGTVPIVPWFSVSRWWDIILGPIYSVSIILHSTQKNMDTEKMGLLNHSVPLMLFFGMIDGAIAGVPGSLFGVVFGLLFYLLLELHGGSPI